MAVDCIYCNGDCTHLIQIGELRSSVLYLLKVQVDRFRCILVYKKHIEELYLLEKEEEEIFFSDLKKACAAISKSSACDKLNLAVFGDYIPHLHVHIVPKYRHHPGFGKPIEIHQKTGELTIEEYDSIIETIRENLYRK